MVKGGINNKVNKREGRDQTDGQTCRRLKWKQLWCLKTC